MDKQTKNYIILIVVIVLTIIAVFYARSWYLETKKYTDESSIMLDVVKEIHVDEISNYTLENPKFILYVASNQNKNVKNLEKEIKQMIIDEELYSNFIYLNTDEVKKSKLNKQLKKIANNRVKIDTSSEMSMYIIENGKITETILNAENMSIEQIKSLLINYGVIDNA